MRNRCPCYRARLAMTNLCLITTQSLHTLIIECAGLEAVASLPHNLLMRADSAGRHRLSTHPENVAYASSANALVRTLP